MSILPEPKPTASEPRVEGRLDSWKEIAAYLKRGVSTVQRWERTEDMPVHRLPHARSGSLYAHRQELDEWWRQRSARLEAEGAVPDEMPAVPVAEPSAAVSGRSHARLSARVRVALSSLVILAAGAAYIAWRERPISKSSVTVAVLPFKNLGGSAEDDYLADGVTEEVTTGLARLQPERLSVIARTSAARYKGGPKSISDVGRELGADYVLEGSVRQAAGRVRITAQLIEVQRQTHVWAEAYEQPLTDLVRTEAEMAEAITRHLSVRLLNTPASPKSTPNPEAHVAYLKGLYFWNKRSEAGLRRAIELFREAIETDPGYAKAHAGLATSYARLATSSDALAGREARALAEAGARRALELDPDLPEGHAALSVVLCQFDWNWNACERELAKTVALDPNYASGRQWLGEHLVQRGLFEDGQRELRAARVLDPVSPTIHTSLGIAYMYGKRYDDALACFTQALEIDPRFLLAHRVKGLTLMRLGRSEEGLASLQRARSIDPGGARAMADTGYALARAGRTSEARALLAELRGIARQRRVSPYDLAVLHVGLGDKALALEHLEKGYADGATGVRWLRVEPIFDPLRGEPRFAELLRRIGLPD